MRIALTILEAISLVLALCSAASGQTATVYSYQRTAGVRGAHVWAVFEHKGERVEISWMCDSESPPLVLRGNGENWTHADTLAHAKKVKAEVKSIGPIPISDVTFKRAKARKAALESGLVDYKFAAVVFGNRANCIHAVAAVGRGPFVSGCAYGHEAARRVARHLLGE